MTIERVIAVSRQEEAMIAAVLAADVLGLRWDALDPRRQAQIMESARRLRELVIRFQDDAAE